MAPRTRAAASALTEDSRNAKKARVSSPPRAVEPVPHAPVVDSDSDDDSVLSLDVHYKPSAAEIAMDLREAAEEKKENVRQQKERDHIMACEAMREGDYDSDESDADSDGSEDSMDREMRQEAKLIARDEARSRIRDYKYPKAEAAARKRITAQVHQKMLEQCGSDPEDHED